MSRFKGWVVKKLLGFLGINHLCALPLESFYKEVSHGLMYVPRVFGSDELVEIGVGVVLNDALMNTSSGRIKIGDYSFFGHGVSLITGAHDYFQKGYLRQISVPREGRDIEIGSGVWVGSNVTILGPCCIGDNSVIAAGTVVVGDIESNSVYAGIPSRKLKDIDF